MRHLAATSGYGSAPGDTDDETPFTSSLPMRAPPEADAGDDDATKQKKELWKTWWFEARNANALDVLSKMPDAKIDAKTPSKIDPKATQAWVPGGYTAVTLAAQRNDAESIAMLAKLGADLDARDDNGAAPLHHAAFENAVDAIGALLDAGCDPNVQDDRDGSTAAILAAYGMRRAALNALIDRHPAVDLTLRDVGHATVAGHCAQRGMRDELVKILVLCGPGGASRMRRGQKDYLAKKAQLTGQFEVLTDDQLREVARSWRARLQGGDDRKAVIVKLLQTTP